MQLTFDEMNPNYGYAPVNDGQIWRSQPWLVFSNLTNTSIAVSTAASIFTQPGKGNLVLPAGILNYPGRALICDFAGYATTGGTPGNLYAFAKLGSNVVSTTAAATLTASLTTIGFSGRVVLTCKQANAAGGTGLIDTSGVLNIQAISATLAPPFANGTTAGTQAPGTQIAIDQTASYQFDLQLKQSTTNDTFVITTATVTILPF